jgi:hypothetical protein
MKITTTTRSHLALGMLVSTGYVLRSLLEICKSGSYGRRQHKTSILGYGDERHWLVSYFLSKCWLINIKLDVKNIFAVLQPGVNIERVMEEWARWAKILAIQLVDNLYVFHFARSPSAVLGDHIIARFRAASMREALQELLHVHIEEIPVGGELSSLLSSV